MRATRQVLPWYGGLGVSLGVFEPWKRQKVGGCGWNRCPWNFDLSHVAQDTTCSWIWGWYAHSGPILAVFLAAFRTYRGVRGQQRALCHKNIKLHMVFSTRFPSFARFEQVARLFLAKRKKAIFVSKWRKFGSTPPDLAPTPQGAIGELWAQIQHLGRPCVNAEDG